MSKVIVSATPEHLEYFGIDGDLSGEEVTLTGKVYRTGYVQIECPPSKMMQEVAEITGKSVENRLFDIPKWHLKDE